MGATLLVIWDYDTGIGQINSTYPYQYREETIHQEIQNVEKILELSKVYEHRMTFAVTGIAGEAGGYPYHIRDQIRSVSEQGHEIASHSWKHEWFPFLESKQIELSLTRSKQTLEHCIGLDNSVLGFVPPFSRPMSWIARGALSLGDRVGPWAPGADLGSLLRLVSNAGYRWCRVTFQPVWMKIFKPKSKILSRSWIHHRQIVCVPQHYVGFDSPAQKLLDQVVREKGTLVISGHPSGLNRSGHENSKHFEEFLRLVSKYREQNRLNVSTVVDYLQAEVWK